MPPLKIVLNQKAENVSMSVLVAVDGNATNFADISEVRNTGGNDKQTTTNLESGNSNAILFVTPKKFFFFFFFF